MLQKDPKGFITLSIFSKFPELIHGFSTRGFGNMKIFAFPSWIEKLPDKNIQIAGKIHGASPELRQILQNRFQFARALEIEADNFVFMEQKHKTVISKVFSHDSNTYIQDADGLITKEENLFLFVAIADCIPLLFYDFKNRAVGICHAGWRGTLEKIGPKMVAKLRKNFGSKPKDLIIGFGPSIGACCYEVKKDVEGKFGKVFGKDREIIQKRNGKIFLDLRLANYKLLLKVGCNPKSIDVPLVCTSCQNDIFYSLRKERDKLEGEIAAIIGMRK